MTRVVIYPYKMASQSAIALQDWLKEHGVRCIRARENGTYHPLLSDVVITWGNPRLPSWLTPSPRGVRDLLNYPLYVNVAHNKLLTFQRLQERGVSIPEYTCDREIARRWGCVVARQVLTGSGGKGITLCSKHQEIPEAPLYVCYVKKSAEYRVHVFRGQVIDIQEKRKRRDFEGTVDTKIRNHNKGWVFCRDDVHAPDSVIQQALRAVEALGLDFGAVDVIYNRHYNRAFVLEVNTAPGLEGSTVDSYGNAILTFLRR